VAETRICAVDGCGKKRLALGYCRAHYRFLKRNGSPLDRKITERGLPLSFLRNLVGHEGEECVIWPYGRLSNGYPVVGVGGRGCVASRVICEMVYGPVPFAGAEAAHSCGNGNKGCVNPCHLSWKSPLENSADKYRHGTIVRGSSIRSSKLTENDVLDIRLRLASGDTVSGIARDYGVWPAAISRIKTGRRWGWL
jgi:hypothetical protein